MARKSLVSVVENGLLERIVDGVYAIGASLPSEAELATDFDITGSRCARRCGRSRPRA